jgi:H+/Na+-translocating ferredoxin:NAD+ oxidoreductase subunit C
MDILNKVKSFRGGVHPDEHKNLTEDSPLETMRNPKRIILPLSQHIGKQAKALVAKKDIVNTGCMIAEPDGFVSAPIHSSVSGTVKQIQKEPNASGTPKESIIIDASEENDFIIYPKLDPRTITAEEIWERVKIAGIVGQGGAAFPTFIKLTPPKDKIIDHVILNGCECEPYLTRDYRLMIEKSFHVLSGLSLILKALNVHSGSVGIEDNKPEAIKIMQSVALDFPNINIEVVKTKYPQGAEKMLIKAVLGREVPPGKLPLDIGVVIQNIGTAVAIHEAIAEGMPLVTAPLTVSGKGIKNPKNLYVPVGTPLSDVLDYCGGVKDDAVKVVVGGPMMGITQYDFSAPIMKATSGILVLTKDEINEHAETPCLKCGKCIDVCPLSLMPTKLARYSQLDKLEQAEELDITVCMECGTCAYTCPANIPLVQWIRLGKQRVLKLKREHQSN